MKRQKEIKLNELQLNVLLSDEKKTATGICRITGFIVTVARAFVKRELQ